MFRKLRQFLSILADIMIYGRKKEWWDKEEIIGVKRQARAKIAKRIRGREKLKKQYGINKR